VTLSRHQPTITVTRRSEVGATWLGVDSRRPLSGKDQAMVTRLVEALMEADRLALELPAVLHLMRDHQAGQPRAQSLTPSTAGGDWVDDDVERPTGHHDPTGDAAVRPDRAVSDQRQLHRHVEAAISHIDAAIAVANGYPTQAVEPADVEPTPGSELCKSCWKDRKYCQPVTLRPDGVPYHSGLCRWCGEARKSIGADPPTWMLERRHRGERITTTMIEKAKAEAQAQKIHKSKGKGKKRR